jgi:hypothetical protein
MVWSSCSFTLIHSRTGPVGQLFAFSLGGSSLYPENAPTLAMEPGSPVTDVLLHWWPWCDVITTLALQGTTHLYLLATQWPVRAAQVAGGGGGGGGAMWRPYFLTPIHSLTSPVGQPSASYLRGQQFSSLRPRDAPTLTMEPGSAVAMSCYSGLF